MDLANSPENRFRKESYGFGEVLQLGEASPDVIQVGPNAVPEHTTYPDGDEHETILPVAAPTSLSTPTETQPFCETPVHDESLFPLNDSPTEVELTRSKSSFTIAVRKKFQRSKSSFQALSKRDNDEVSTPSLPTDTTQVQRPKVTRLRSLISASVSRSQSSASIHSIASISSNTTTSSSHIQPTVVDLRPATSALDVLQPLGPAIVPDTADFRNSSSIRLNADDLAGAITLPLRSKGKSRAQTPFLRRPQLLSASTGIVPAAPVQALRLELPRTMSMPVQSSKPTTASSLVPRRKMDYFGTILPRELQLMILWTLVKSCEATTGNGKWDGEAGGQRQLIRFSRVST